MSKLETLASKELRAEPFSEEERTFLKQVMTLRSNGCGEPDFNGWYPKLYLDGQAARLKPVVADVHTDTDGGRVLEAGVGEATFLVVAVDSGPDRAVYVGPAYSYYELSHPVSHRMTDQAWIERLAKSPPARPEWTRTFQPPRSHRELAFDRRVERIRQPQGDGGVGGP